MEELLGGSRRTWFSSNKQRQKLDSLATIRRSSSAIARNRPVPKLWYRCWHVVPQYHTLRIKAKLQNSTDAPTFENIADSIKSCDDIFQPLPQSQKPWFTTRETKLLSPIRARNEAEHLLSQNGSKATKIRYKLARKQLKQAINSVKEERSQSFVNGVNGKNVTRIPHGNE